MSHDPKKPSLPILSTRDLASLPSLETQGQMVRDKDKVKIGGEKV